MAGEVGFEPTDDSSSPAAFKAAALSRSTILPYKVAIYVMKGNYSSKLYAFATAPYNQRVHRLCLSLQTGRALFYARTLEVMTPLR